MHPAFAIRTENAKHFAFNNFGRRTSRTLQKENRKREIDTLSMLINSNWYVAKIEMGEINQILDALSMLINSNWYDA